MWWGLHVAEQAIKARLPFANEIRNLKRRIGGYAPHPANIGSTFDDLATLHDLMAQSGVAVRGTVLEIGSGWFPIVPILLRVAGAERVILTDVQRHMDQQTFLLARQAVLDRIDRVQSDFGADPAQASAMLRSAETPEQLGLTYLAPFRPAMVADGSVDLLVSRACLEHIPVADLAALLRDLRPKLSSSSAMAHVIDNSDHLAQVDKSLTRLNFLTWPAWFHQLEWRLAKEGENRLRHHEYRPLFEAAGYRITGERVFCPDNVRASVKQLRLAPPYDRMSEEDLATVTSWFVLESARCDAPTPSRGRPGGS